MSSLEATPRRRRPASKMKTMGDHKAFLARIKKSLYYGKLPSTDRFSMPVSELAAELFSGAHGGLRRLAASDAGCVSRAACASPCALVLALVYLDRLRAAQPDYLHRTPPDELFLVSLLVASKFLQDEGQADEVVGGAWAASAHLSPNHLLRLERDFLNAIGWDVFVSSTDFWLRLARVERLVALREAVRRGWFTYADLVAVASANHVASLTHAFLSVSAVCVASYTAGVLALIGSCFLVSHVPGSAIGPPLRPAPLATPLETAPTPTLDLEAPWPCGNGTDPLQQRLAQSPPAVTWTNGNAARSSNHDAAHPWPTNGDPLDLPTWQRTNRNADRTWPANEDLAPRNEAPKSTNEEAVFAWLTNEAWRENGSWSANREPGRPANGSSSWLRWWRTWWQNETWLLLAPPISATC